MKVKNNSLRNSEKPLTHVVNTVIFTKGAVTLDRFILARLQFPRFTSIYQAYKTYLLDNLLEKFYSNP